MKNFTLLIPLLLITNFISAQQWRVADQPEGGQIASIDVSPYDTTKIVVMVKKDLEPSIWYSEDAGESWRKIGEISPYAGDVKIDPVNNRIYASGWGMVIATTDEGVTWDTLYETQDKIEDLDFNPADPSKIFFINRDGIYRSTDFGNEWTLYPHYHYASSREFKWSPHDTNHIIVTEYSQILKSSDKGATWSAIWVPGGSSPIIFDPLQDSVLYKRTSTLDSSWIVRSTDYGNSWSYFPGLYHRTPKISYKENGAAAFLTYGFFGIYKTLDYGVTWHPVSRPQNTSIVHYNGINFYAGFLSDGFAVYRGGDIWEYRNKGIKGIDFYSMTITDSHTYLSTYNNTFRKSNSSPEGEWESLRPDSALWDICFYNDSIGFARDYNYNIYRTGDGGNSWQHFHDFFSTGKIEHIGIAGTWLFAAITNSGGDHGLYRLSIGQTSWSKVLDGYNTRVIIDSSAVYGFYNFYPATLQKSNFGANWVPFADVHPGLAYRAFSPKQNSNGFLLGGTTDTGGQGLLYFIDNTGSVTTLVSGPGIFGAAAPAGRDAYFYITKHRSIIYKADSIGGQPYQFDEGLPVIPVDQGGKTLFYFDLPGYQNKIYTNRGGLWVLDLDEVTASDELKANFDFALEQNYPNPFNPVTTIKFEIPEPGDVTIKIYNMLGQEVRTLFSGYVQSGTHSLEWSGLNDSGRMLSSGAYIYRMTAGEFTGTRKMILLK